MYSLLRRFSPAILFLCGLSTSSFAADLKEKTVVVFDRYVAATEARFNN